MTFSEISVFVFQSNAADVSLLTPIWSPTSGDVVYVNHATNSAVITPTVLRSGTKVTCL